MTYSASGLKNHHIYTRKETGEFFTVEDYPIGAMWDAWWMGHPGPDGISLMVRLPNKSDWWVDGPSKDGGHWTRTGTVPNVTARPSIFSNQGKPSEYHGFLTNGVLSSC